ncbi:MBL fold metallo-hydrolase [Syntrophomonas palmitatica]|uniref:MBL fold metallo-hydrolase n=1 Tax=Syntrophomonas palmitatica TaxID=402877 RepID=UPI0006D29444|nr:MBL fold metallo-hydrolase [Syntrophomonas palmitatica]
MDSSSFTIHKIEGYIANIYLFQYDNGLLLFDSGCINDVRRIEEYCRRNGLSPSDIKLIAVSHMHPDHCGGAKVLREKYNIPVAAHRDVDLWYSGIGGSLQHKFDCYMARNVARHNRRKCEKMLFDRVIKPDFLLDDGQRLPGFSDWQAMYVPGHTLHDLVFYHHEKRVLYLADLICNIKGKKLLPMPILFPDKMAYSYDRLAALHASTLLLAHGNPIESDDSPEIFAAMKAQLNRPPNNLMRRVYRISVYSPEARRELFKT